jgi:hypothetical protein
MQSETAAGASDELLIGLIEPVEGQAQEDFWNNLSFAARCLEFIVPSSKVRSTVTSACLNHCVAWAADQVRQGLWAKEYAPESRPHKSEEVLSALTSCGAENRKTVSGRVEELLLGTIRQGSPSTSVAALDIAVTLQMLLIPYDLVGKANGSSHEVWTELGKRVISGCSEQLKTFSRDYFHLCFTAVVEHHVKVEDLISWHGLDALFRSRHFLLAWIQQIPLAVLLLQKLLHVPRHGEGADDVDKVLQDVGKIGRDALTISPPWMKEEGVGMYLSLLLDYDQTPWRQHFPETHPAADELFGAFVLVAAMLEAEEDAFSGSLSKHLFEILERSDAALLTVMRPIIMARYEPREPSSTQLAMEEWGLSDKQQIFVWRWLRREANIVAVSDKPEAP